jgi:hypothetical protein
MAGWMANVRFHWPTVEAVAINIGTAVGLAGLIWVMERRFERHTAMLEQRIETVTERLSPAPEEVRLRPRDEILGEYR